MNAVFCNTGNNNTMDNRAQSIGIIRFFAALALGAALSFFAVKVTTPILDRASTQSAGTAAAPASSWLTTFGENIVLIFLLVSFFGLIVLSVYQRRVRG